MDNGILGSAFSIITGYDGLSSNYTVISADGIVTGQSYRFMTIAVNSIGDSDPSNEVRFAVTDLP